MHIVARRAVTLVGAATLACLALAAPAAAAIVDRGSYHDEFGFSDDSCGFDVDIHVARTGVTQIRAGGDPETFFLHDQYAWHEVDVRRSDGATITLDGNGLFVETHAVHLDGTVYRFYAHDTGALVTVRDAAGRVVVRDRGTVRKVIDFDTLGDGQPGGTVLDKLSETYSGHFGSFDSDLCAFFDA